MNFLSKRAQAIAPYTAGEQPADKQYVKLNTNENPYPPSPRATEVLRTFDAGALRLYPRPDADGLRAAIARAEGVGESNVFCGNGSDEVLEGWKRATSSAATGRTKCWRSPSPPSSTKGGSLPVLQTLLIAFTKSSPPFSA